MFPRASSTRHAFLLLGGDQSHLTRPLDQLVARRRTELSVDVPPVRLDRVRREPELSRDAGEREPGKEPVEHTTLRLGELLAEKPFMPWSSVERDVGRSAELVQHPCVWELVELGAGQRKCVARARRVSQAVPSNREVEKSMDVPVRRLT